MPIWLPFSEGSVAEKNANDQIRKQHFSQESRQEASRFHGPRQCNGNWLVSRIVIYSPNILGRAMYSFLVYKLFFCGLRFLSPCFLVQSFQKEIKSRIRYNRASSFRKLVLASDVVITAILQILILIEEGGRFTSLFNDCYLTG